MKKTLLILLKDLSVGIIKCENNWRIYTFDKWSKPTNIIHIRLVSVPNIKKKYNGNTDIGTLYRQVPKIKVPISTEYRKKLLGYTLF